MRHSLNQKLKMPEDKTNMRKKNYIIFFFIFFYILINIYGKDLKNPKSLRSIERSLKEEEKYHFLDSEAEKFLLNDNKEKAIKIFSFLLRTGHLNKEKQNTINAVIADYFYKEGLYGIAIGFFEDHYKQGNYFPENFFLDMGKTYENLGKVNKARKLYENTLSVSDLPENILTSELQALDKVKYILETEKRGILIIDIIHPTRPYTLGEPMLLDVIIRNTGVKSTKIDPIINDDVARSIAVVLVRDWSKIITYNQKNVSNPAYTHPGLESIDYRKTIPAINSKDIIELRPGDEYKFTIDLWKYLEKYSYEIDKQEEPVLEEFREYFVCVLYKSFLLSKDNILELYSEPVYSNALLISFVKREK